MTQSDRETSAAGVARSMGLEDAWELAPGLVAAGWETGSMQELQATFEPDNLKIVLRWLASGCIWLTRCWMRSAWVRTHVRDRALGQSLPYLDQGPVQQVDLHQGLEDTLVILRHKMKDGISIKRYLQEMHPIEAHGSELNLVWTNILDNAVDAMGKRRRSRSGAPGEGEGSSRFRIMARILLEIRSGCSNRSSPPSHRGWEPAWGCISPIQWSTTMRGGSISRPSLARHVSRSRCRYNSLR
jgi:hypothetical protein